MFMAICKWIARKSCIKRWCLSCRLPSSFISGLPVFEETLRKSLLSIVTGSTQDSNINSSSHLCSSKIGRALTQALCYVAILCNSSDGKVCFSSNPCFTGDSPYETWFLEKQNFLPFFLSCWALGWTYISNDFQNLLWEEKKRFHFSRPLDPLLEKKTVP